MVKCVGFTLVFLHIPPIILKSEFLHDKFLATVLILYPIRALLATIRNLGKTPCPRCMVPKERIKDLGTANDVARRVNLARHDSHPLRSTIKRARAAIYERGKGVKSTAVEDVLGPNSYVPTIVS